MKTGVAMSVETQFQIQRDQQAPDPDIGGQLPKAFSRSKSVAVLPRRLYWLRTDQFHNTSKKYKEYKKHGGARKEKKDREQ